MSDERREERRIDSREQRRDQGHGPRSRGALVNFYEDLGFSTTPEAYQSYKEAEGQYLAQREIDLKKLEEDRGALKGYQAKYNKMKESIPSIDKVLEDGWRKTQSGWVDVYVVDGLYNKVTNYKDKPDDRGEIAESGWKPKHEVGYKRVVSKHKVPRQYAESLMKSRGKGGLTGMEHEGRFLIDSQTQTSGPLWDRSSKNISGTLNDTLNAAVDKLKKDYWDQMAPKVKAQLKGPSAELEKANQYVTNMELDINRRQESLNAMERQRTADLEDLRKSYQARVASIGKVLGGLKVGE